MFFGTPTTPGGWGLMILSLRLIYIDVRQLDDLYERERAQICQSPNVTATLLTLSLTLDFLGLFFAFDSVISAAGGIILGLVLFIPLFRKAEKEPKNNSATAMVLRRRTSSKRWSQELKDLLLRRDNSTPEFDLGENQEIYDGLDAGFERSSAAVAHGDLPSRPPSRRSKSTSPHANRVKFHDFFDFNLPALSPSPEGLSTHSDGELDLDFDDFETTCSYPAELPVLEVLELQVDDWVQLRDGQQGIIRFLGGRMSSATEWIGIEIIPDIAVNGAIAADWPSEAGVYVRPSAVERIIHRPQMERVKVSMRDDPVEDERPSWSWRRSTQSVHTLRTLASITEMPEESSEEGSEPGEAGFVTSGEQETALGDQHAGIIVDDQEQESRGEHIDDDNTPLPWTKLPETTPQIWTKSSDTTLNASELCSDSSTIGFVVEERDDLDEDSPNIQELEAIDFEAGLFSRRASSEADDEHEVCHGCSIGVEDTDEFEARMEMLVSGLDNILAATKRDLERGGLVFDHKQERASNNAEPAEAPVVKDNYRRSFDINGTVGLPSKLRRRWKEWTKSAGQDEVFDLVAGVRTGYLG